MSEFGYGNPLRFIFSIFISQPDYLVQEFACPLAINFRVHYLKDFIFRFPVNYNQCKDQLCSLRERVGCSGFKHEHMENWINRVYGLQKTEGEQQCTRLNDNFIRSKIFFRRLSSSEELSLDKDFVTYFEIRSRRTLCISRFLIMLLGLLQNRLLTYL